MIDEFAVCQRGAAVSYVLARYCISVGIQLGYQLREFVDVRVEHVKEQVFPAAKAETTDIMRHSAIVIAERGVKASRAAHAVSESAAFRRITREDHVVHVRVVRHVPVVENRDICAGVHVFRLDIRSIAY